MDGGEKDPALTPDSGIREMDRSAILERDRQPVPPTTCHSPLSPNPCSRSISLLRPRTQLSSTSHCFSTLPPFSVARDATALTSTSHEALRSCASPRCVGPQQYPACLAPLRQLHCSSLASTTRASPRRSPAVRSTNDLTTPPLRRHRHNISPSPAASSVPLPPPHDFRSGPTYAVPTFHAFEDFRRLQHAPRQPLASNRLRRMFRCRWTWDRWW